MIMIQCRDDCSFKKNIRIFPLYLIRMMKTLLTSLLFIVIAIVATAACRIDTYYEPDPTVDYSVSDFNTTTSDEFIEKYYEPLRMAYPDYICRRTIGKNDSGQYDMWCYEFSPEKYTKTVYIQAGTHGRNEFESYYGTALMMKMITQAVDAGSDPILKYLRENVRYIVVPLVNVYDVSERAKQTRGESHLHVYSPRNYSNINLNRDWTDAHTGEIRNVKALLAQYDTKDFRFAFDQHTDSEGIPGWGGYLLCYADDMPDEINNKLLRVSNYLYDKNVTRKGSDLIKAFMGPKSNYPASSSEWRNRISDDNYKKSKTNWKSCSQGFWKELGIYSSTIEHGSGKFGPLGSRIEMFLALELYVNHLYAQVCP